MEYNKRKTVVIGHKNPDTDSICSAICYANLKSTITGMEYEPGRAGHVSEETQFVLNYFGVDAPRLIKHVKTEVRDIEIRETKGVKKNISLKKAWNTMQASNAVTLPAVTDDGMLEGLITVGDITKSYMNVYDSKILSKANTQYSNIIETVEGDLIVGDADAYFSEGKVLIAAANPDLMEYYINKNDLVILGNRYESQLCAIEMEAACIIVCEGAGVSMTIKKLAQERGCTVIATTYDTYTVARLVNQSMPISYFMKTDNLVTFDENDIIDEIKDVMASKRYRDFPILDKNGRYKGMISRRNLLGAQGKMLILVDHNEKSQAVDGIENARIMEIIDHHRIGSFETEGPVYFRNVPVGCTCTIVYQMYQENGVDPDRSTAGLMLSAILSDTLMFRSPTCTPVDERSARELARLAEVDLEEYADAMFEAGGDITGRTAADIFNGDYKIFDSGEIRFGVGQASYMTEKNRKASQALVGPYLPNALEKQGLDFLFYMFTDVRSSTTELLMAGEGAAALVEQAFGVQITDGLAVLPGVVSRKKQMIPALLGAIKLLPEKA